MAEKKKPPYRVPSMAEIAKIKWNGLTLVDLFSGCGGSCLGFRMAGYRVLWANEFVPIAQESYRANMRKGTILDGRDVREIKAEEILAATNLKVGELDCLSGSPPCQSFSSAGRREKGWGKNKKYTHGAEQKNEELFTDFIRLRDGIRPRTFVAENVSGLIKGTAKGFFLEILRELKKGYRVEARLLDAQWLGVPQQRQRIIFVGVRDDLGLDPAFPDPLPYRYSVRDAIPWISKATRDNRGAFGNGGDTTNRPSPTVLAGSVGTHWVEAEADISKYAIAQEYDRLSPGESTFYGGRLHRPHPERPCPTVSAAGGISSISSVCHPFERRKFSIEELKRISSFPDDFKLSGTYEEQWERLGNSVPPLMAKAIGEAVRDRVLLPARERDKRSTKPCAGNTRRGSSRRATPAAASRGGNNPPRDAAAPSGDADGGAS
jgi:DNA (cytosine-5)-methyltransferase 1